MDNKIKASRFLSAVASPRGRAFRILVGAAMLSNVFRAKNTRGKIIAFVGILPLLDAAFDRVSFAPIFGGKAKGKDLRNALLGVN